MRFVSLALFRCSYNTIWKLSFSVHIYVISVDQIHDGIWGYQFKTGNIFTISVKQATQHTSCVKSNKLYSSVWCEEDRNIFVYVKEREMKFIYKYTHARTHKCISTVYAQQDRDNHPVVNCAEYTIHVKKSDRREYSNRVAVEKRKVKRRECEHVSEYNIFSKCSHINRFLFLCGASSANKGCFFLKKSEVFSKEG